MFFHYRFRGFNEGTEGGAHPIGQFFQKVVDEIYKKYLCSYVYIKSFKYFVKIYSKNLEEICLPYVVNIYYNSISLYFFNIRVMAYYTILGIKFINL